MNISISTYQIKQNDTLASIAESLEISVEELRKYHNTYCNIKDLIGHNLDGKQYILIPPSEKIVQLKQKKQIHILNEELPSRFLKKDFYAETYAVNEKFEKNSAEDLSIDYLVHIKLREADEGYIANLRYSDFKKDDEAVNDKISALSIACMESILPIEFAVNLNGKIRKIYNYQDILKKFTAKRSDLEDFFIGDVSKLYMDKFQVYLDDESFLLKQLKFTLLNQVLFPRMDWFHQTKYWEEEIYFKQNSFPLKCLFEAEYNHNDTDFVETTISGKISSHYSLQEVLRGIKSDVVVEEPMLGEIKINYKTDKKNKKLISTEVSVTIWYEEEIYSKQTLTLKELKNEIPKRKFNTLVE